MNQQRERYVVVPALDGDAELGPRYAFTSRFDPCFDVAARTRLFIPLDESAAADRLLNAGVALARPSVASIVLAAIGGDGEQAELLGRVLLPAQARVEAHGLRCERRTLLGARRVGELRAWIGAEGGGARLVLGDPLKLGGALRDLTAALLYERPCASYLLALDGEPIGGVRTRLRGVLERALTRGPHLRHGEIAR